MIGFLFAINGEINSADTYGSSALFLKLWPRLLKAAAIEAVAESDVEEINRTVSLADIETFFENSEIAPIADERKVTDRIKMLTRESKATVFIESLDSGVLLHRNYIMK